MLTVHYSGTGEPPGGLGVPSLLALEDCGFEAVYGGKSVAAGMPVTRRPPHGSGFALLKHSGFWSKTAQSPIRIALNWCEEFRNRQQDYGMHP